ncbi:hypothetical protein BH09ACT8_BH09ACT8_12080 [soil metagenome]
MGRHQFGDVGHYRHQPWYREAKVVAASAVFAVTSIATAVVLIVTQPPEGAAEIATAVESAHSGPDRHPSTAAPRILERVSVVPPQVASPVLPAPPPFEEQVATSAAPRQVSRVDPPLQKKAPQSRVSTPPSMSFAPKPVTPPQTATPGTNQQRHGLLF